MAALHAIYPLFKSLPILQSNFSKGLEGSHMRKMFLKLACPALAHVQTLLHTLGDIQLPLGRANTRSLWLIQLHPTSLSVTDAVALGLVP